MGWVSEILVVTGLEESAVMVSPTLDVALFMTQLFIIRVKRELKRVYRNGCRYNERLNDETGGSKTPLTHRVPRVNI
jgi:hypothetical protein